MDRENTDKQIAPMISIIMLQAASRSPAANTFLDNAFAVYGYFAPSPSITPYTK